MYVTWTVAAGAEDFTKRCLFGLSEADRLTGQLWDEYYDGGRIGYQIYSRQHGESLEFDNDVVVNSLKSILALEIICGALQNGSAFVDLDHEFTDCETFLCDLYRALWPTARPDEVMEICNRTLDELLACRTSGFVPWLDSDVKSRIIDAVGEFYWVCLNYGYNK